MKMKVNRNERGRGGMKKKMKKREKRMKEREKRMKERERRR